MSDESLDARTDLTIVPANEGKDKTIGFACYERLGTEIFKSLDAGPDGELVPVTNRDDLKTGDTIYVSGLMGGYHVMIVESVPGVELTAKSVQSPDFMAVLSYGISPDEKLWPSAWLCVGLINLRGIRKLTVTRSE